MKKLYLILLSLLLTATSLYGQIVTPSLDSAIATREPTATARRSQSVVAIHFRQLAGTSKGDRFNSEGEVRYEETSPPIVGALAFEEGAEAGAFDVLIQSEINVTTDADGDTSAGGPSTFTSTQSISENRLHLGIVITDNIAVAVGNQTNRSESNGNFYPSANNDVSEEEIYNYGVNFRFAELFYFAIGQEMKTLSGSRTDIFFNVEVDKVEATVNSLFYGIAMRTGELGDTRFRIEYSVIDTPEVDESATSGKFANSIGKTTEIFISAEALFTKYLLSYRQSDETIEQVGGNVVTTETLVGIGYISEDGVFVSFYSLSRITEDEIAKHTVEISGFELNIGSTF